ncbi:MAG: hypothetical protein ABFS37_01570 [Acidobacteriota bacterium]
MRNRKFSGPFICLAVLCLVTCFWALPAGAEGTVTSVAEDKANDTDPVQGGVAPRGTGGPDAFGYTWIDSAEAGGPAYSWFDIASTGTDMAQIDDSYYWPITLPFTFDFYGTGYTDIAVGSNGTVYFTDAYLGYANVCLPGDPGYNVPTFIAVYHDDLDASSGGAVYYEIIGSSPDRRLIVQFDQVPHFGTSDPITAQVVLFEGSNNILLQYLDPSSEAGSGATVGIQGDASTALEFSCNTAALTADLAVCFAHPAGGDSNCSAPVPVALQSFDVE